MSKHTANLLLFPICSNCGHVFKDKTINIDDNMICPICGCKLESIVGPALDQILSANEKEINFKELYKIKEI